jgi:hypothetical protein
MKLVQSSLPPLMDPAPRLTDRPWTGGGPAGSVGADPGRRPGPWAVACDPLAGAVACGPLAVAVAVARVRRPVIWVDPSSLGVRTQC